MTEATEPEDRAASRLVDRVAEIIGGLSALGLVFVLLLLIVQAVTLVFEAGPVAVLGPWALAATFLGLLLWLAFGLRGRRRWARFGAIGYCALIAVVHAASAPWGVASYALAVAAAAVAVLLAGPTVGREFKKRDA